MSLAPASSRGAFLNARLAVNGIQCAARSLGTATADLFGLLSSMGGLFWVLRALRLDHRLSVSPWPRNADSRAISAQLGGLQIGSRDPEHFALGILGIEPEQRQLRKGGLEIVAAAADFAEQSALRRKVRLGLGQDAPDDVEPVGATVEGERRFNPAFGRQAGHALGIDIGRVGDDEIVALVAKRREEIATVQRDAIVKGVIRNIAGSYSERIFGNVDGVDRGMGEMAGGEDRKAAAAGAEVEHACDIGGIADQRGRILVITAEM